MNVLIKRFKYTMYATYGTLIVCDDIGHVVFNCMTLELPWLMNEKNISCIPNGTYQIKYLPSAKFGHAWEFIYVPNRSEIKFHAGNFTHQIQGCILLGTSHVDIDGDGLPDIALSRSAVWQFEKALSGEDSVKVYIL